MKKGIIVPAPSESSAERLANIHSQNMTPEPPELKKSGIHRSTAMEIMKSRIGDGSGWENAYDVADERIE